MCEEISHVVYNDKTVDVACCVCSGGLHKTVSPSLSPTETFKPTAFSVLAMTRTKGCSNEKNWRVGDGLVLYAGMTCDMIESSNNPKKYCDAISKSDDGAFMRKSVSEACCICGGNDLWSVGPSSSPSTDPTSSPMPSMHAYPSMFPSSNPSDSCLDDPDWFFDNKNKLGCEDLSGPYSREMCVRFQYLGSLTSCCVCKNVPSCYDVSEWRVGGEGTYAGISCVMIEEMSEGRPSTAEKYCTAIYNEKDTVYVGLSVREACCICGREENAFIASSFSSSKQELSSSGDIQVADEAPFKTLRAFDRTETTFAISQAPSAQPSKSQAPSFSAQPSSVPTASPSMCVDEPDWYFDLENQLGCQDIRGPNFRSLCNRFSKDVYQSKNVLTACCICGGGRQLSTVPSPSPSLSVMPTTSPSDSTQPSMKPSTNPSPIPSNSLSPSESPTASEGALYDGDPCNVDFECRQGVCVSGHCNAPNVFVAFIDAETGHETSIDCSLHGEYGGAHGNSTGSRLFQDSVAGGVFVDAGTDKIHMFGNAWKAYRLTQPVEVNRFTKVQFDFTLVQETEGHAICFDEDTNLDTYGSQHIRCLALAGTQTFLWDDVMKLNLALGKPASQHPESSIGAVASKAVDGRKEQLLWIDNQDFNSIAQTEVSKSPWWSVELGNDDEEFEIHSVLIYPRLDFPVLPDFDVIVYQGNGNLVRTINVKESSRDSFVIKVNFPRFNQTIGNIVRIQIPETTESNEEHALSLAEVEVLGIPRKVQDGNTHHYEDVSIGLLFPRKSTINYVAFVQDSDADQTVGHSIFENVVFYDDLPDDVTPQPIFKNTIISKMTRRTGISFNGIDIAPSDFQNLVSLSTTQVQMSPPNKRCHTYTAKFERAAYNWNHNTRQIIEVETNEDSCYTPSPGYCSYLGTSQNIWDVLSVSEPSLPDKCTLNDGYIKDLKRDQATGDYNSNEGRLCSSECNCGGKAVCANDERCPQHTFCFETQGATFIVPGCKGPKPNKDWSYCGYRWLIDNTQVKELSNDKLIVDEGRSTFDASTVLKDGDYGTCTGNGNSWKREDQSPKITMDLSDNGSPRIVQHLKIVTQQFENFSADDFGNLKVSFFHPDAAETFTKTFEAADKNDDDQRQLWYFNFELPQPVLASRVEIVKTSMPYKLLLCEVEVFGSTLRDLTTSSTFPPPSFGLYGQSNILLHNFGATRVIDKIVIPNNPDRSEEKVKVEVFSGKDEEALFSSSYQAFDSDGQTPLEINEFGKNGNEKLFVKGRVIEVSFENEFKTFDDSDTFQVFGAHENPSMGGSNDIVSPSRTYRLYLRSTEYILERIDPREEYNLGLLQSGNMHKTAALSDHGHLIYKFQYDLLVGVRIFSFHTKTTEWTLSTNTNALAIISKSNEHCMIAYSHFTSSLPIVSVRNYSFFPDGSGTVDIKCPIEEAGCDQSFGTQIAFSEDGKSIAIAAPSATNPQGENQAGAVFLFRRDNSGVWIYVMTKYGENEDEKLGLNGVALVREGQNIRLVVRGYGPSKLKMFSVTSEECPTPNSHAVAASYEINPFQLDCECDAGYISTSGELRHTARSDFCSPCALSSFTKVGTTFIQFTATSSYGEDHKTSLAKRVDDTMQNVPLISDNFHPSAIDPNTNTKHLHFDDLHPGTYYSITLESSETNKSEMQCNVVASCSCEETDIEKTGIERTGRPRNFEIDQNAGHVMFTFTDNSRCADAYSFLRLEDTHEFMSNLDEFGVSFTSDYAFTSAAKCNNPKIDPGTHASDDLTISRLPIGKKFTYCVRAVKSPQYMDVPFSRLLQTRTISSSLSICDVHTILFEASIAGLVTTDPYAGNLPIANVSVHWEILGSDALMPLRCSGCSGSVDTMEGGSFRIHIKADAKELFEKNDHDIPIRLRFSKTTISGGQAIPHVFLCNEGRQICDFQEGYIEYVKHLLFDKPVHIFDDTSIPFSGKVIVDGTDCPIHNATVCATNEIDADLACAATDANGNYEVAVIIGSIVHGVSISYHSHVFEPTADNSYNYASGIRMEVGKLYNGNDFRDISKAEISVEVAGAQCNKYLGKSYFQLSILGCKWKKYLAEETSGIYKSLFRNVPAAILEVQVVKVTDEKNEDKIIDHITEFFRNKPEIRTIDMLNVGLAEAALDRTVDSNSATGVSGTPNDQLNTGVLGEAPGSEQNNVVRFQYDGKLIMIVDITSGAKKNDCKVPTDVTANSFHVIPYMTNFTSEINLRHELVKDQIYCDIVDTEKYSVIVESDVGLDENSGFIEFWNGLANNVTKDLLKECSNSDPPGGIADGPCVVSLVNQIVDDLPKTTASKNLATGRPNPFGTYTRNIFFSVTGGEEDVTHTAAVFIEGVYSKGPGNSFALPTHNPIMVLRDPPGGNSFASYENIVTTAKLVTYTDNVHGRTEIESILKIGIKSDVDTCTGPPGVEICTPVSKDKADHQFPIDLEMSSDFRDASRKSSNSFSTTWSYSTSDTPARAGIESDVFVVPNLNVMYEDALQVYWDSNACGPILNETGNVFPSVVVFDIESPKNKPALTFYSRYHIINFIIPELDDSLSTQKTNYENMEKAISSGKMLCCADVGYCTDGETTKRQCNAEDFVFEQRRIEVLDVALRSWRTNLKDTIVPEEIDGKTMVSISEWFDTNRKFVNFIESEDENDLAIDGHPAALAPKQLIDKATDLPDATNALKSAGRAEDPSDNSVIEGTQRIQFSGDTGAYTLTMTQEAMKSFAYQNCNALNALEGALAGAGAVAGTGAAAGAGSTILVTQSLATVFGTSLSAGATASAGATGAAAGGAAAAPLLLPVAAGAAVIGNSVAGCNYVLDMSVGSGTEFEAGKLVANIAGKLDYKVALHIEHSSNIEESGESQTSISFELSDPDDGDEFVVDIYHDKKYNNLAFQTVAGRSRCVYEDRTIAGEDPKISVVSKPSQFVFPDEKMVFEVEFANLGEHLYSYFLVAQDRSPTGSSLETRLDNGYKLDEFGHEIMLTREETIRKQIFITRGSGYESEPVQLVLKSKCESLIDNIKKKVTVPLSNYVDSNGVASLKWLEPCPSVEWAGQLKWNKKFLVNTNSRSPGKLTVKVFNPKAGNGVSFKDMTTTGRLEHIHLLYRRIGEVQWKSAYAFNDLQKLTVIDFAADSTSEDNYGYLALDWTLMGMVSEGKYEIVIESSCADVGGPDEFSNYRTISLPGTIDWTRPEQYGKALPLRHDVIVGEEITVVFTEALDCSYPYSFDMQVTIYAAEQNYILDKDDLFIVCEGRKISFQLDLSIGLDPSWIVGKRFDVELGRIGGGSESSIKDMNGNRMDPLQGNIKFEKRFGDLDLSSASTSFTFSMKDVVCTDETAATQSEDIRTEIASLLGMEDTDSIRVSGDISCHNMDTLIATIELIPENIDDSSRRLQGEGLTSSYTSFERFKQLHENLSDEGSKLSMESEGSGSRSRFLESQEEIHDQILIHSVRIIPSASDVEKFKTSPDMVDEEEALLKLISIDAGGTGDGSGLSTSHSDAIRKLELLSDKFEKEKEMLREEKESDMEKLEALEERKLEAMKEEMKWEKEEELKSMKLEREEELKSMKEMFLVQGVIVLIGCSLATLAIVMQMRR